MTEYRLTSAVASELGCSDATIRTLKSRNKSALLEGQHWEKTPDNRTVWSDEGVEILRSLLTGQTIPQSGETFDTREIQDFSDWAETEPQSTDTVIDVSSHLADEQQPVDATAVDALIASAGDALAYQLLQQRLPQAVNASLQRILLTPTPQDCERLATMLDRLVEGLTAMKACSLISDAFQHSLQASRADLQAKGLPVPASNGAALLRSADAEGDAA